MLDVIETNVMRKLLPTHWLCKYLCSWCSNSIEQIFSPRILTCERSESESEVWCKLLVTVDFILCSDDTAPLWNSFMTMSLLRAYCDRWKNS